MSDPKRIRDIPGFFLRQRSRVELVEFYDIESCFLSRFGVIPGGKPRQNTLMKAGQDPDNTGPEKYAQTQHILLAVLHSDYVIGSALHGSFGKARRLHHPTDSPHGPTQWGLHMGTVGIQCIIQLPHHMDPHKENCWISSQSPPYRETVGTQCQILKSTQGSDQDRQFLGH